MSLFKAMTPLKGYNRQTGLLQDLLPKKTNQINQSYVNTGNFQNELANMDNNTELDLTDLNSSDQLAFEQAMNNLYNNPSSTPDNIQSDGLNIATNAPIYDDLESGDTSGLDNYLSPNTSKFSSFDERQEDIDKQQNDYYDYLKSAISQKPNLTGGQIASQMMLTFLPSLIARMSGNKNLRNASANTAPETAKFIDLQNQQAEKDRMNLLEIEAKQRQQAINNRQNRLDRDYNREEALQDRIQYRQMFPTNTGGGGSKEVSPEAKETAITSLMTLQGLPREKAEAMVNVYGIDKLGYGATSFSQDANKKQSLLNEERKMAGLTYARSLPEKSRDVLDDTERFNSELKVGREKLAKVDSIGLDRLATGIFDPNSNEAEFNAFLESLKRSYAIAKNKGTLSENDVKAFDPLFEGSTSSIIASYRSKERFADLFNTLENLANKNAKMELKGALANKVNPETVKDIAYAYNINLDESSTEQDIKTDKQGIQWQIIRDASGKPIGKKRI